MRDRVGAQLRQRRRIGVEQRERPGPGGGQRLRPRPRLRAPLRGSARPPRATGPTSRKREQRLRSVGSSREGWLVTSSTSVRGGGSSSVLSSALRREAVHRFRGRDDRDLVTTTVRGQRQLGDRSRTWLDEDLRANPLRARAA